MRLSIALAAFSLLVACSGSPCPEPDIRDRTDCACAPTPDVVCPELPLQDAPVGGDAAPVDAPPVPQADSSDTMDTVGEDVGESVQPKLTITPTYEGDREFETLHVLLFRQAGTGLVDASGVDVSCEALDNILSSGLRPAPPEPAFTSTAMTLGDSFSLDDAPIQAMFPDDWQFHFTALALGVDSLDVVVVAGCDDSRAHLDLRPTGQPVAFELPMSDVPPPPPVAMCPPGHAPGDDGGCYAVSGTLSYDDCSFLSSCSGEGVEIFDDVDCTGAPSPGPELVFEVSGWGDVTVAIEVSTEAERPTEAPRVSVLRGAPLPNRCVDAWEMESDDGFPSRTAHATAHWRPRTSGPYFVVISFPDAPVALSLCRSYPPDGQVCPWYEGCRQSRPDHCPPGTVWNAIERGCWPCPEGACDDQPVDRRTCGGTARTCEGVGICTREGCAENPLPSELRVEDVASWLHWTHRLSYDPWGRRSQEDVRDKEWMVQTRQRWTHDEWGAAVSVCGGSIDYYTQDVYEWSCHERRYTRDDTGVVTRMEIVAEDAEDPVEVWTYDWYAEDGVSTVTRDGFSTGESPDGGVDTRWTLHWDDAGLLASVEVDGGVSAGGGMGDEHPGDLHLASMAVGRSLNWGPYEGFRIPPLWDPIHPDYGAPDGTVDVRWTFTYADDALRYVDLALMPPFEYAVRSTWSTDETGRPTHMIGSQGWYNCSYDYATGPALDSLKKECPCPFP